MLFALLIYLSFFILHVYNAIVISETIHNLENADSTDLNLLVLTNVNDESLIRNQYSEIFSHLISKRHKISIKSFLDNNLNLMEYEELVYKNIVIFDIEHSNYRPSFPISLVPKLLEFIDNDGNVMVFVDTLSGEGSSEHNKGMSRLAKECADISFLPRNTQLIDISEVNLRRDGYVYSNKCIRSEAVFSTGTCNGKGILYHGVGFSMNVPDNELIIPILSACDTCISIFNEIRSANLNLFGNGIHSSTGEEIGLVVSMQGRNNARVTFSGDGWLCSDVAFRKNENNAVFCKEILSWTFRQRGLIRMSNVVHHKLNESPQINENYNNTLTYTVEDTVFFSAMFHELVNNDWEVYKHNDIQLEFTMLDPYLRIFLDRNQTDDRNTAFTTVFKVPETWGVFKFVINHNKLGYNSVFYESLTTVRNFRHDQNPRFAIQGFPYYACFVLTAISLCYFAFIFIFYDFNYHAKIRTE